MLEPRVCMVIRPSVSPCASPGSCPPMPIFQYDEPGTTIWPMKKKWFIVSNAWMAPARRTATTDAPTLHRNMSPFAFATRPDRSMSAFISVDTSAKYVGEARMIPSASSIFSIQLLRISSVIPHRLSWSEKHLPHKLQPRISDPASWTSSVLMPSVSSSASTALTRMAVLPFFRALPLNATTFMIPSSWVFTGRRFS